MAEKRKPTIKLVLQFRRKVEPAKWQTVRMEIFPAELWKRKGIEPQRGCRQFRLRVGGKWFSRAGGVDLMTLSEIMVLVRKSLIGKLNQRVRHAAGTR